MKKIITLRLRVEEEFALEIKGQVQDFVDDFIDPAAAVQVGDVEIEDEKTEQAES